jgi:N-acetylglucosamine-6-phosphate deacetylase
MRTLIKNANVVTRDAVLENCCLAYEDGVITYIGQEETSADSVIDANGQFAVPGFIDIHCHGGNGFDFMDGKESEFKAISDFHLKHGTTTLVATTMASDWEEIENTLKAYAKHKEEFPDSTLCGVHMEDLGFLPKGVGRNP